MNSSERAEHDQAIHRAAHRRAQMLHARRRAAQRYGLDLSPALQRLAIDAVESGQAAFIRTTNGRKVYLLSVGGRALRVVYDPHLRSIATVLPDKARHGRPRGPRSPRLGADECDGGRQKVLRRKRRARDKR
jgi:hypothetical protein